jgi:hypothetical protein
VKQDFTKRAIIVVRRDLVGWQSHNAVAHVSAFIGNRLWNSFGTGDSFISKDGAHYPRNSQYPIIVKRANSSEQLRNLLEKARHEDVLHHAFIREMLALNEDDAIQKLLNTKHDHEMELLAVGVFGENDMVSSMTKKYGLWE